MRKIIGAIILAISFLPLAIGAVETNTLKDFLQGNIIEQNAKYFGLNSVDELKDASFGTAMDIGLINGSTLENSSETDYSIVSEEKYIPVLINGVAKFFIVIDIDSNPVSIGYKTLADELNKISQNYNVKLGSVKLYQSLSINAFLFSVPGTRDNNLTVLRKDWDKNRSSLTPLLETLEILKSAEKGAK